MKFLMTFGLFLISAVAFAEPSCSIVAEGISAEARANLDKACQAALPTSTDKIRSVVKEAAQNAEYGNLAKDIALAIGIAARELGVAVNEFFNSPAGTLTVLLIVWKVMGVEVLSFIAGIFALYILYNVVRRTLSYVWVESTEWADKPMLWGLFTRRVKANQKLHHMNEDRAIVTCIILVIAIVAGVGIIGSLLA